MTDSLVPYNAPRHIDRDAWLLHETSSIAYYERCARLCEEFGRACAVEGVGPSGSSYLAHAGDIRRGIEILKISGDYMPLKEFLQLPSLDPRAPTAQAWGDEGREELLRAHQRMSLACAIGAGTLANNPWKGAHWAWLVQGMVSHEEVPNLDQDEAHHGDQSMTVQYLVELGLARPLAQYPRHPIDHRIQAIPGQLCPRTGVWVPSQWADEGAGNFSLAFCVEGRAMQPAYQILGLQKHVISEAEPEYGLEEFASYSPKTKAVATTWYFVEKAAPLAQQPADEAFLRLPGEANT